jgi:DNA-binding CsgD family transcriptional regulator
MNGPSEHRPAAFRDDDMRTLIDLAIERIYGAAIGEVSWKDALAAVARSVGVERAILYTPELTEGSVGLWASYDAFRRPRQPLRVVDAVPADPASSSETVFSALLGDGGEPTMPATLFVLFDSAPARRNPSIAPTAGVLARHLSLAVRLWFRKHAARQGAETLAGAINAAVFIADRDGRVSWMNPHAGHWLREGTLVLSRGLVSEIRGLGVDLARLFRDACDGVPATVWSADGRITLQLVPVAMPAKGRGQAGAGVLVALRDREGCRQVAAELARKFDLTPSETDLAIALARGVLVAEYAERRSVAMSTVRTQLKSLLAKTGSRRQSDVVSVVARMQPLIATPDRGPREAD